MVYPDTLAILRYMQSSPEQRARTDAAWRACSMLGMALWILIGAIVLAARGKSTACIHFLQWSLVPIGLLFVVLFCVSSIRVDLLYLILLFVATLSFVAFMIFSYVAVGVDVRPSPDEDTTAEPVPELKLSDYRVWLRGRLADPHYWATVTACLRHRHTCEGIGHLVREPKSGLLVPVHKYKNDHRSLPPIQSGCCKPPSSCAFTYINGTMWTTPPAGAPAVVTTNDEDVDCSRWSNDAQTLCFQCDSCKAGVIQDMKIAWTNLAFLYGIFMSVFAICYLPTEVCSYRNGARGRSGRNQ